MIAVFCSAFSFAQNGLNFFSEEVDGDYVQTNYNGISGDANRTVEAWIKTDGLFHPGDGGSQGIIVDWGTVGTGQRFTFNVLFNNALRIEIQGGGLSGTIPVNDGVWHHVAVVFDNEIENNYKLYVDGVLDVEGPIDITIDTGESVDLRIGARVDGNKYFTGTIDEVRVWDRALSVEELIENMNLEFCEPQENLVAYYKLNEGIAGADNDGVDMTADVAGGGFDGELIGFDLDGGISNWVEGVDLEVGFVTASVDIISCELVYEVPSGDETYDTPGEYMDTIPTVMGCDSIITINLTFAPAAVEESLSPIECDMYTSPGGVVYEASALFTEVLYSEIGCDSVIYTIDLTILESTFDTLNIVFCEPTYTVPSGDETYTESGIYHDTIPNVAGCDSLLTIYLTVEETVFMTEEVIACDSFTSESGVAYMVTGLYEEVFLSEAGCDSVILSLDITILESTTAEIDTIVCADEFISPSGEVITMDGVYTAVIENEAGCDSTITMNVSFVVFFLEVITTEPTLMANYESVGLSYQWVDCDNDMMPIDGATEQSFAPEDNGSYAVVLTENGCMDTTDCYEIASVGLSDALFNAEISMYPNPTNGAVAIDLGKAYNQSIIRVMSVDGKVLNSYKYSNKALVNFEINQPVGTYFIQITADDKSTVLRIVKN